MKSVVVVAVVIVMTVVAVIIKTLIADWGAATMRTMVD